MSQTPAWLNELLDNPLVQILAFILAYALRVELDRRLRKQDSRRQKKRKGGASA